MARIVLFNYPAFGHIHPNLAVVAELVRRGHQVTCTATEHLAPVIESTGATALVYESVFGDYFQSTFSADSLREIPAKGLDDAVAQVAAVEQHITADDVDIVCHDTATPSGRFYAQKHHKPVVRLFPTYAKNDAFSLESRFPFDVPPAERIKKMMANIGALLPRFGFHDGPQAFFAQPPDLGVVFVDEEFHYERATFADRYVFTGPCIQDRSDFQGSWQPQQQPTGHKTVLVSLGTATTGWPEFFPMVLQALAQPTWRLIIATGGNLDPEELGLLPANVEVHQRVPQLDVLPHVDAFVTHGGMNSVMEALHFGVPMVVIPQMSEQTATAARVAELGLGQHLAKDQTDAETLRRAVTDVLSNHTITTTVAAFSTRMQTVDGVTLAADAIECFPGGASRGTPGVSESGLGC